MELVENKYFATMIMNKISSNQNTKKKKKRTIVNIKMNEIIYYQNQNDTPKTQNSLIRIQYG